MLADLLLFVAALLFIFLGFAQITLTAFIQNSNIDMMLR